MFCSVSDSKTSIFNNVFTVRSHGLIFIGFFDYSLIKDWFRKGVCFYCYYGRG